MRIYILHSLRLAGSCVCTSIYALPMLLYILVSDTNESILFCFHPLLLLHQSTYCTQHESIFLDIKPNEILAKMCAWSKRLVISGIFLVVGWSWCWCYCRLLSLLFFFSITQFVHINRVSRKFCVNITEKKIYLWDETFFFYYTLLQSSPLLLNFSAGIYAAH